MSRPDLKDTEYLGDGVMAGFDGFHVWIYLADGHIDRSAREGIALEPHTLARLQQYMESLRCGRRRWLNRRQDASTTPTRAP